MYLGVYVYVYVRAYVSRLDQAGQRVMQLITIFLQETINLYIFKNKIYLLSLLVFFQKSISIDFKANNGC